MTFPWLTVLGLVPIVGSLLAFLLKGRAGKVAGLAVALGTLVLAVVVGVQAKLGGGFALGEDLPWISAFGAHYALGLDGMGLLMVLMTAIITPVVLCAEWNVSETAGRWHGNIYFGLALLLEGLSLYVFMATDVLLFYLFFEATLLPMYFMIGAYGGAKRQYAAIKFLLFSLAGGLVMLASVVGLYYASARRGTPTMLVSQLAGLHLDGGLARWLMVGFLVAFMVKAPMVPVHTWLPDACEDSTPGTATLLVGVLDKIGTFGMIRYCLGLFPEASQWVAPFMIIMAVIAVIYGGLVAIGQQNLMRLVAFTSISHFGFMVLGIYAFTTQSTTGSVFYMLNHGFSTAALFLAIGFIAHRRGSFEMPAFGGVQKVAPVAAGVLLVAGLATLSLPGLSPFVSEFLVLAGSWSRHPVATAIACFGMVLAALYVLLMYQKTMTGPVTPQVAERVTSDLTLAERLVIAPVLIVMLVLGFFPKPAIQLAEHTAQATMAAVGVQDPQPQAGKGGK